MISRHEVIDIIKNTKKTYCCYLFEKSINFGPRLNGFCRDIEKKNTQYLDDEELVHLACIIQTEYDLSRTQPYSAKIGAIYKLEALFGGAVSWALRGLYHNEKDGDFRYENILAVIRHPDPNALVAAFTRLNICIKTGKGLSQGNHDIEPPNHAAILDEMRVHPKPEEFIESKSKEILDFYVEQHDNAKRCHP